MDEKPVLEVGMTGLERTRGSQISLGVAVAPLNAVVQGAGLTWRMSAKACCKKLARNPHLQTRVNQYIYVLMGQMATSAGCTRFHEIEPRLALWLSMALITYHRGALEVLDRPRLEAVACSCYHIERSAYADLLH